MDIKAYARSFHAPTDRVGNDDDREPTITPSVPSYLCRKRKGYIYYAGDGNGRIKIGFSTNPWSRVKEMRCANPSISVLVTEKVDDGLATEKERHEEFKEYHLALEWFSTGERLIQWINHLRENVSKGVVFSNPPMMVKDMVQNYRTNYGRI